MKQQQTLKKPIEMMGTGLHSGQSIRLNLVPAPVNAGIVFKRTDLDPIINIPALTPFVGDTRMNTCLINQQARVATVEHLMAALAGMQIDNCFVELDAAEPPALDGSALEFVNLIEQAGITVQDSARRYIRIKNKIVVEHEGKLACLAPYDGQSFEFTIEFEHPVIKQSNQSLRFELTPSAFKKEISGARTFGFIKEYEYLKANHLALGASMENTLVLDEVKLLNPEILRYSDEFVRHKILDAIGDIYLLGHPVIGAFQGIKSGHEMNHQLRQALLNNPNAWEFQYFSE